jgi:hypothetical protein
MNKIIRLRRQNMIIHYWCYNIWRGSPKYSQKNVLQYHLVLYQYHADGPRKEQGLPQ